MILKLTFTALDELADLVSAVSEMCSGYHIGMVLLEQDLHANLLLGKERVRVGKGRGGEGDGEMVKADSPHVQNVLTSRQCSEA